MYLEMTPVMKPRAVSTPIIKSVCQNTAADHREKNPKRHSYTIIPDEDHHYETIPEGQYNNDKDDLEGQYQ